MHLPDMTAPGTLPQAAGNCPALIRQLLFLNFSGGDTASGNTDVRHQVSRDVHGGTLSKKPPPPKIQISVWCLAKPVKLN